MDIQRIREAAKRLEGHVRKTPLLNSPFIDDIAGRRVFVKPEALQHTGSFKFRGAWSAISNLGDNALKTGVIAYSSGNHAQGVANAAREHGCRATIIMPADAPQLKIDNTRALGAEVVLYDRHSEDRDEIGQRLAKKDGLTLIKPYDEPDVIAGQGTVGLEIAEQAKAAGIENAEVLVCCGGGGLTSGVALGLAAEAPGFKVRPVEPVDFDDVARSLEAGEILQNAPNSDTFFDAIVTPAPGDLTFPILKTHAGSGLVVTREETERAMAIAFARLKVVLEPGGAVSLAAAIFHGSEINADTVIAVASGGNVDPEIFQDIIAQRGVGE